MKNMEEVGIRALKQNASQVVARAAAGEVVVVTDRGRAVAQLSAHRGSVLERLRSSGELREARHRIVDVPQPQAGPSLSEAIEADRLDQRY